MTGYRRSAQQGRRPRIEVNTNEELMNWAFGGTFGRTTSGSYRASNSSVGFVGVNVRRFERNAMMFESGRTSVARQSEDLSAADWVKTNCTVSANVIAAPDGATTGDSLTTTASGVVTTIAQTAPTVPAGNTAFTVWVRGDESYTANWDITAGAATINANFTVTTGWTQISGRLGGATVATTITFSLHASGGTGTAGRVLYLWGLEWENSSVSLSYTPTTTANVAKGADVLTYASGTWNPALARNNFMIKWRPFWDNLGLNVIGDILSYGGINDRISMSAGDALVVTSGGVAVATSSALTWNRDQELTFKFFPSVGTIIVSGASSGNGTTVGTAWTMPTAVTLRAGGRQGGTAEINGTLSNPVRFV